MINTDTLALPGAARSDALGASSRQEGRAQLPTLAVLPLRNLTQDPADGYFCEGVIEDLVVSLAGLHDLFVIARGSTLGLYRDASPETISQRLGVRYVLGGSVQRDDKRLRFTFELTDAEIGSIIWADRYDCGFADLFNLQDDISERIVGLIASHVREAEIKRARRKRPEKLDAYDYLLQALDLLHRLDYKSFSRAKAALDRAIEADDEYAAAYAYAAQWHIFNIGQGWSNDSSADANEALRLSAAAIERDPFHAQALAVHGHAKGMCFRDYDAALDFFDRAVAASPNNSWAWMLSSGTHGYLGNAGTSIQRAERALRLSPLDQYGFYHLSFLGLGHYLNNSFEEAVIWTRKSFVLNPKFCSNLRFLAASLSALGRFEEAKDVGTRHMLLQPRFRLSTYAPRCPFKSAAVNAEWLARLGSAGFSA